MLRATLGTHEREHLWTQAQKAKDYARHVILVSRTSPEENAKEACYKHAHNACIQHMRLIAIQAWEEPLQLETDLRVLEFEAFVAASAKYSIGNCSELCLQVLDYYLTHDPDNQTRVELFCLADPSDHVFVVINRDKNSDEDKPHTWGKDALICDPLMNTIYLAQDYKMHLTDFEYDLQQNTYIPFNDAQHHLQAIPGFSSDYLNEHRQAQYLADRLQQKFSILISVMQVHHDTLSTLQSQLRNIYGARSEVIQLLALKLKSLKQQLQSLSQHLKTLQMQSFKQAQYRDTYANLHLHFETEYVATLDCIRFTDKEIAIIQQQPNTALGRWFGLFHQSSPAYVALEKALANCQINLDTRVLTHTGAFRSGL